MRLKINMLGDKQYFVENEQKERFIKKITNDNGELLNSIVFIEENIAINPSKIISIVVKEDNKKRNSSMNFSVGDDGPGGK